MAQKNGIANVDTKQMEEMRQTVVEQELSARSWIAMQQKMEATIAIHKLQAEYDEVVKYNQTKLDEQRKNMQEMFEKLQADMKTQGAEIVTDTIEQD